jgi:uncharacterized protein with PQ loop repeat
VYFYELEQFGRNWLLTASFLLLGLITTWQWRAYILQSQKIWRNERAKSVSVTLVTFQFFIVAAGFVYGVNTHSLIIAYTGTTSVIIARIVRGTWRFGRVNKWDRPILWAGVGILALTPFAPTLIYSCLIFVGALPLLVQVREIYKNKTRGDLHGEWLFTLLTKSVLWSVFAYSGPDLVYKIFSPVYLLLHTTLVYQWWYYREKGHKKEVVGI